jgi:hypothetical protein
MLPRNDIRWSQINRKRATQLRMTLRLESIYGLILLKSACHPRQRFPSHSSGRYLSGNLCVRGFAGYDSLFVGFQILLHKSLLDLALNFSPKASVSNSFTA